MEAFRYQICWFWLLGLFEGGLSVWCCGFCGFLELLGWGFGFNVWYIFWFSSMHLRKSRVGYLVDEKGCCVVTEVFFGLNFGYMLTISAILMLIDVGFQL